MVIIYILVDPRYLGLLSVRYCGKTKRTLAERMKTGYAGYTGNWIKSLRLQGLEPIQIEIDRVEELDWVFAEKLYIAHLRALGCLLTNLTEGGDGVSGCQWSTESKARRSQAMMGHTLPEETKTKIGAANKGKKRSDEFKANVSAFHKGKPRAEETKAKISAALQGHAVSEDQRKRHSELIKGRPNPAVSVARKGSKASEETKLRMSEAQKRIGNHPPSHLGKKRSEETKLKMSRAQKRRISLEQCLITV